MSDNNIILRMEHISKSFGPVHALSDVSFQVRKGAVHALCGENGAGKSTLMKILSGVHTPDSGTIEIDGSPCVFDGPADAIQKGVSMLYQELELADYLTVYENVFLGSEILSNKLIHKVDTAEEIARTKKLIDQYHFRIDPTAMISSLTPGECQIVELLKALMRKVSIIVMDEPTSSLSESEAQTLFQIINELRTQGIAVIYISHRLEEVMELADDISVLRDGVVVHSAPRKDLTMDEIVRHMVGQRINDYYPARLTTPGEVRFKAENISCEAAGVSGVSFEVKRGEIVGMAGLVGAGRSETASAIFGILPKLTGRCWLDGKELTIRCPSDAIRQGIALLTEDRKRTGLCLGLPCSWNITLPNYGKIGMDKKLQLAKEHQLCSEYGNELKLKWSEPDAPANSLSGGNQQKILLARWLMANSDFLIFDEPTRGIDVGAKKEIYNLLNQLSAEGKAILVISSELPEIFGICDRILVMRRGKLAGCLNTKETTQAEVIHIAAIEQDNINS